MMNNFWKYILWCFCATVWASLFFIVPDFIDNPIGNWKTLTIVCTYILAVGIFHFLLIYLIGLKQQICAVLLPIYALLGGVCSYYRLFYHLSITSPLLDAVFHTHVREAAGVISFWLIAWIILCLLIAVAFVIIRYHYIQGGRNQWSGLIGLLLIIAYYFAIPRLREALDTRYPLNVYHSLVEYISEQHRPPVARQSPAIEQSNVPDSLIVIAVLGEAARADHLQLNGYDRPTNPLLRNQRGIVTLPHIYSQYTNTNSSVPHILTRADSTHTEYAHTESSFISLFHAAGFYSAWLTNKNQNRAFLDFMQECDTIQYTTAALTQALYAKWLDEELLPLMDGHLGYASKQIFVLHTMGSHWLYDTHVSDALCIFQPSVTNRELRQNTVDQIINSYDNTMVYLDTFLYALILRLAHYPAIILYLSDHGESLGEGGRFLHSQPDAEEEKYPAALVWYSDTYQALFPEKVAALHKNSQRSYRTDYFFYSILSAAGIEVEGNNSGFDIFKD